MSKRDAVDEAISCGVLEELPKEPMTTPSDTPRTVILRSGIQTVNGITGETAPTYSEYVLLEDYQRDLVAAQERIRTLTEASVNVGGHMADCSAGVAAAVADYHERMRSAESALAQERQARERDSKDAERYRYMRNLRTDVLHEHLDAFIDAAIAEGK